MTRPGAPGPFPEIPLTKVEQRRDFILRELAAAVQAEIEKTGKTAALRGAAALRFGAGVTRPAAALEFEGPKRIGIRKLVKRALKAAGPRLKFRVTRGWLRGGPPTAKIRDERTGKWIRIRIIYKKTRDKDRPDRGGATAGTASDEELAHGVVERVLGKGGRPRAADIYDAAWFISQRPEAINADDAAKLKAWVDKLDHGARKRFRKMLRRDPVIGRRDDYQIWRRFTTGVERLGPKKTTERGDPAGARGGGPETAEKESGHRRRTPHGGGSAPKPDTEGPGR